MSSAHQEPEQPAQSQAESFLTAEKAKAQAGAAPPEDAGASAIGAAISATEDKPGLTTAIGHHRWVICALLFFATAINYIDRQVFSILAPELQKTIGWSEAEYGTIVFSFHVAYAIGL